MQSVTEAAQHGIERASRDLVTAAHGIAEGRDLVTNIVDLGSASHAYLANTVTLRTVDAMLSEAFFRADDR